MKTNSVLQAFGIKVAGEETGTELKDFAPPSQPVPSLAATSSSGLSFLPANFSARPLEPEGKVEESYGPTRSEQLVETLLTYPLEEEKGETTRLDYFKSQARDFDKSDIRVALSLLLPKDMVDAAVAYYRSFSTESQNTPLEHILPILLPTYRLELCQQCPAQIEEPKALGKWLAKEDIKSIFKDYKGKGQEFAGLKQFLALLEASPDVEPLAAFLQVEVYFVKADVACALSLLPVKDRLKGVGRCFHGGVVVEDAGAIEVQDLIRCVLLPSQAMELFKKESQKFLIQQTWGYHGELLEILGRLTPEEIAKCVSLHRKKLEDDQAILAILEKLPPNKIAPFFKQYAEELYSAADFDKRIQRFRSKMPDGEWQDFDDYMKEFKKQHSLSKEKVIASVKNAGTKIVDVASELATGVKNLAKQVPDIFAKKITQDVIVLPSIEDSEEIAPLYGDILLQELAAQCPVPADQPKSMARFMYFSAQIQQFNRQNLVFALTLLPIQQRPGAVDVYYANSVADEKQISLESIMPVISPSDRPLVYKKHISKAHTLSAILVWLPSLSSNVLVSLPLADAMTNGSVIVNNSAMREICNLFVVSFVENLREESQEKADLKVFTDMVARKETYTEELFVSTLLLLSPQNILKGLKEYYFAGLSQFLLQAMLPAFPPSQRLQMIKELLVARPWEDVEPLLPLLSNSDQTVAKFLYQVWRNESEFLAIINELSAEQIDECLSLRQGELVQDWVIFGIAERLPADKKLPFFKEHSALVLDSPKFEQRIASFVETFSGPAWVDCIGYVAILKKQHEQLVSLTNQDKPLQDEYEIHSAPDLDAATKEVEVKAEKVQVVTGHPTTFFFSPSVGKIPADNKKNNVTIPANNAIQTIILELLKCSDTIEKKSGVSQRLAHFQKKIYWFTRKNILVALSLLPREEKMAAVAAYYATKTREANDTTLECIYPVFLPMDLLALYAKYPKKLANRHAFLALLNREDRSEVLSISNRAEGDPELSAIGSGDPEEYSGYFGLNRLVEYLKVPNIKPLDCFNQAIASFNSDNIVCALSFLPLVDRPKAILEYLFSANGVRKASTPLPAMLHMLLPSDRKPVQNKISMLIFVRQMWTDESELLASMKSLSAQQIAEGVRFQKYELTEDWAIFAILNKLPPHQIKPFFIEHETHLVQSPLFASSVHKLKARVPDEEWQEFSDHIDTLKKQQQLAVANANASNTNDVIASVASSFSTGMNKFSKWFAAKVSSSTSSANIATMPDSTVNNNSSLPRPGASFSSSETK